MNLFFKLLRPTPWAPINTNVFLWKGGILATSSYIWISWRSNSECKRKMENRHIRLSLDGWKISAILFNKSLVVFYPFALKNLCKLENACVLSLSYILSIKTFLTNSSVEIIPLIYVIKLQISLCNFFSQLVRYQIRKTAVHLLWLLTSVPQNECAFPII